MRLLNVDVFLKELIKSFKFSCEVNVRCFKFIIEQEALVTSWIDRLQILNAMLEKFDFISLFDFLKW